MSEDTMKNGYDPANLDQPSANVVDFQDVVKKFGSKTVLDGVSFAIKPGSVFALLGENGAGKTTTIRMVLGETAPTSGLIRVFEQNPIKRSKDIRERIGFIPESPTLYEYMTVGQIGRFAAAFNRKGYPQKYAERCEELGLNEKDRIRTLSKGLKAKTSLALELARDPDVLVLDEPTSGLDALVRRQILADVAELGAMGKTILLSSHQTAEVERVADHVAFLKNGKFVLMDSIENIRQATRVVDATISGETADGAAFEPLFASIFEGEYVGMERYGLRYRILGQKLSRNFDERLRASLGARLLGTEVSIPSLEDVFVAYMRKR
jgi:ABC-2 type transport system ATP-binding protein